MNKENLNKFENERMDEELLTALESERQQLFDNELEQNLLQQSFPMIHEAPERKKLKRELEREALTRLEDSARSEDDFIEVTNWWNKLDSNRERRERYHEIGRSVVPLEWGASPQTVIIPNPIQHVYWKQIMLGEFLDAIFDCPFEMHELVTDIDISNTIMELKDMHKEILYYLAIRQYSCQQLACIRGQSDRNIRKVRDTLLKKIHKKVLAVLAERIRKGIPLSRIEKGFVHDNESEIY